MKSWEYPFVRTKNSKKIWEIAIRKVNKTFRFSSTDFHIEFNIHFPCTTDALDVYYAHMDVKIWVEYDNVSTVILKLKFFKENLDILKIGHEIHRRVKS